MLMFAEVHPFSSVTAEPIAVDIVAPDQVKPEPAPPKTQPSEALDLPTPSAAPSPTPPAAPPPAAQPPTQAATPPPKQAAAQPEQQAALAPDPVGQQPVAQSSSPSPSPPPSPAYIPAQPDLSIKYHVMLGLPMDRPADGFDAPAIQKADVGSGLVAEFRRHLRTCSTLPESIAASDKIAIKLRVLMNPDGRLAAAPMLIEASASATGPILMQSAIAALKACEPYAMLPANKYREWKVLDLTFTPQDFTGAS